VLVDERGVYQNIKQRHSDSFWLIIGETKLPDLNSTKDIIFPEKNHTLNFVISQGLVLEPVLFTITMPNLWNKDPLFIQSTSNFKPNHILFVITTKSCNLIGSEECDLFLNCILVCSKSHPWRLTNQRRDLSRFNQSQQRIKGTHSSFPEESFLGGFSYIFEEIRYSKHRKRSQNLFGMVKKVFLQ